MQLLAGKVAIITGASSGIGYAAAKLFSQHGAKLIIGARRQQELDTLAKTLRREGGQVNVLAGDVSEENYNQQLADLALNEFGKLDIAFNNAGTLGTPTPIADTTTSEWNHVINTNLSSAFMAAKHQIPLMQEKGGSIIFTSSFVGYTVGIPNHAAYAASKAGIIGLTKALASEYGANNIRVNAILPGGTDTAMAAEFCTSEEEREFVRGIHAVKRIATPEEIAQSALYLASDMSSFTTGTAMLTDGGVSISRT